MNWQNIYLQTFIPEIPSILNNNFVSFKRYLDIIYDENRGIIVVPVSTSGKIKGATGEFVTCVVDNLIVKNQFTNLYSNNTSIDADFTNLLNSSLDTSTRAADPSLNENLSFRYIDLNTPYVKILDNDVSIAFRSTNVGQEFKIIWDVSYGNDFYVMLNPTHYLTVATSDASLSRIKLICNNIDISNGNCSWYIKEYSGNFSIGLI